MTVPAHEATAADRPVLLVVGSGFRPYREYIMRSLRDHYRLWLLDGREATWQLSYAEGATQVDTGAPEAVRDAARAVAARLPVAGVFTYDESQVVFCARLAEDLGLPGSPAATIEACRDKAATRSTLAAAGVPQPASRVVESARQARDVADEIGYPVVVKARGLAGSFGVVRADDAEAVAAAFAAADGAQFPGMPRRESGNVLVEEFLAGPEFSVDAVVFEGEVLPTVFARKHLSAAPYFEEIGHDVSAGDALLSDEEVLGQLRTIHRVLGFRYGATHTEFRLTAAGPRLIEVNARLGGDFIPYLGHLATGVDPVLAAAHVAVGKRPDVTPSRQAVAAVRFLYPPGRCEAVDVVVYEERFGATIYETGVTAVPGQRLALPPDAYMSRYGHVIAVGDDLEQVTADLAVAHELVELVAKP